VRDAAEFHYPEVSYWVISLRPPEPEVRCFRWTRTEFSEIPALLRGVCLGTTRGVDKGVK
jgi:hypothetical protein